MLERREPNLCAVRKERLCIVMTCEDVAEAALVGSLISKVNSVSLVTYRKAQDVLLNHPAGRVVLIILATAESPQAMRKTLAWMRHRWPHSPISVIADEGGGGLEMVARAHGATYLTRPVKPSEWSALIDHVLTVQRRVKTEVELGEGA